jgi:predicted nucleotide-binding protein
VLELGYFLGRLGRRPVAALVATGVELPSDYSGVIYIALDEQGAWQFHLAKELRAAGLPVKADALI